MRVIAGTLRSRVLLAPHGHDTRPTHARVREALFSILGPMTDRTVLDLCAGTGALGIEALSRGASHAVFVESAKDALRALARNVEELGLDASSTIISSDLKASRPRLRERSPFDIIFCDPPWARTTEILRTLESIPIGGLLSDSGRFILEHSAKFEMKPATLSLVELVDTRRWGDTAMSLFAAAPKATATAPDAAEKVVEGMK